MASKNAMVMLIGLLVVVALIGAYYYQTQMAAPAAGAASAGAPAAGGAAPAGSTPLSLHFCEQDYAKNNISCPAGKNLKINSFKYWRQGAGCVFPQNPSQSFADCAGKDYAAQMQGFVKGGQLVFAQPVNNMLNDDPCPNIYKQVDVSYECN